MAVTIYIYKRRKVSTDRESILEMGDVEASRAIMEPYEEFSYRGPEAVERARDDWSRGATGLQTSHESTESLSWDQLFDTIALSDNPLLNTESDQSTATTAL